MDDVSTVYADPINLSTEAQQFANMADPGDVTFAPGQQRGDSDQKDAYYHMNVVFTRNLTYKDYGKQRKKLNLKSMGRYKV